MTELSVLERVRAAVAEAGYDPTAVMPCDDPDDYWMSDAVFPDEVKWRARETAAAGRLLCRCCFSSNGSGQVAVGCLAERRFVEDCGRDRSEQ